MLGLRKHTCIHAGALCTLYAQSKARAGGLYVDHPGCCSVAQAVSQLLRRGDAGRKDGCVHVSSVLGSAPSQVRPRSPLFAKLIIAPSFFQILSFFSNRRERTIFGSFWATRYIEMKEIFLKSGF